MASRKSTVCPTCGQEAPIVYRGIVAYCTACSAVRTSLSSASVNLAGTPSRAGSTVATVMGWLVLVFGGSTAAGAVLFFMMLGWTALAYWVGLPIGLLTLLIGVSLLRGGRSLAKSATRTENETLRQAVLAMAAHKGAVTARDAAQALGMGVAEADALLTQLAKSDPERVGVDVDDEGNVWYRVAARPGEALPGIPRVRVGEGPRVAGADEADAEQPATGEETEEARKRARS